MTWVFSLHEYFLALNLTEKWYPKLTKKFVKMTLVMPGFVYILFSIDEYFWICQKKCQKIRQKWPSKLTKKFVKIKWVLSSFVYMLCHLTNIFEFDRESDKKSVKISFVWICLHTIFISRLFLWIKIEFDRKIQELCEFLLDLLFFSHVLICLVRIIFPVRLLHDIILLHCHRKKNQCGKNQ